MKKKLLYLILLVFIIVFVFIPKRRADLYIRIYFEENEAPVQGKYCTLYYTTISQNEFSTEQSLSSDINHVDSQVEFRLTALLENELTGIRIDFPSAEQLLCIKNITVSNAGVIKRQFNPCDFFSSDGITYTHDISAISLVTSRERAYLATLPDNPYVILSDKLCEQITSCYSHFVLTKLTVCVFVLVCCYFAKRKVFPENTF